MIEYNIDKKTEQIIATKPFWVSNMNPLGYQFFNLLELDLNKIDIIYKNINKKEKLIKRNPKLITLDSGEQIPFNPIDFGKADDLQYLSIPQIEKEYYKNKKQFISDVLVIKAYFDITNFDNNNKLPINLKSFMYYLSYLQIKLPNNYSVFEKMPYYEFEPLSYKNYEQHVFVARNYLDLTIKSFNQKDNENEIYTCYGILDLCLACLHFILSHDYSIKRCSNCGKIFVAYNRSDTIYCDRTSPQDKTKTCKEYGAIKTYQDNLKTNEAMGLYRKIYMQKQMLAKRNPDIPFYKYDFEEYKKYSKQWKADVKAGTKTEAEYIEWLKAVKEKRL